MNACRYFPCWTVGALIFWELSAILNSKGRLIWFVCFVYWVSICRCVLTYVLWQHLLLSTIQAPRELVQTSTAVGSWCLVNSCRWVLSPLVFFFGLHLSNFLNGWPWDSSVSGKNHKLSYVNREGVCNAMSQCTLILSNGLSGGTTFLLRVHW